MLVILAASGAKAQSQPTFTDWTANNIAFACPSLTDSTLKCTVTGTVTTISPDPFSPDVPTALYSTNLTLNTVGFGSFPLTFTGCDDPANINCGGSAASPGLRLSSLDPTGPKCPCPAYPLLPAGYFQETYAMLSLAVGGDSGPWSVSPGTNQAPVDSQPGGAFFNVQNWPPSGNGTSGSSRALPGGSFVEGSTLPPTVQQLAALASDAYKATPQGTGEYNVIQTRNGDFGFGATAYASPDGSQIVIAARGTSSVDDKSHAYTTLADASYVTGGPTVALNSEVIQFASFVKDVANANPGSQITVTGYSLGGGIAQIVGYYANVQTVTFLSPGSKAFLGDFGNSVGYLASLGIPSPSQGIWDYRQIGDVISLAGTQVGTSITLQNPRILPAELLIPPTLAADVAVAWGNYHSLDGLLAPSLANQPATPGVIGSLEQEGDPDAFVLQNLLIAPVSAGIATFVFPGFQKDTLEHFDPPAGYYYSLVDAPGSPEFASIDLPIGGPSQDGC